MRSRELEKSITDCVEEAAAYLHAEIAAGAEVPFELGAQRRARIGATPLYCYRPLTGEFIEERWQALAGLPAHVRAVSQLEGFDGLERYLAGVEGRRPGGGSRAPAQAALKSLLQEVFEDQTEFQLRPERLRAALERLELSEHGGTVQTLVVGTLHGLTLASPELRLSKGLEIAHPEAIEELPAQLSGALPDADGEHLVAIFVAGEEEASEPLTRGREALAQLLRALRLFGDGRVTLGAVGWARIAGGSWLPVALGRGGRPHGMLVVTAQQEDELRAFCGLVARRAPRRGELGWALRRFELGCERDSPLDGLSDHLAALRALLEPEGPASGMLPQRLAALCAKPDQRAELAARVARAVELERSLITGGRVEKRAAKALAGEISEHLRALLSDVVCGHLDAGLAAFADQLLAEERERAEEAAATAAPDASDPAGSDEQPEGDAHGDGEASGGEQEGAAEPDQIPLPVA